MTCCSPSRDDGVPDRELASRPVGGPLAALVPLPGAELILGEDGPWSYPGDGEHRRSATIDGFEIAATAVTNAEFAAFVDATGWCSDAERFGWSFVFGGRLPDDFPATRGVAAAPWWRQVEGATWRHPEGPQSDVDARADHPVVHVSRQDAEAYAGWLGGRLPSEAEWEYAARAGSTSTFPWGDELEPAGEHRMNVFQGDFPAVDTGADGWIGTCPVTAFAPNDFGLWNMLGNVWEWTADAVAPGSALLKGGSYLCHTSWCHRYRPAARMGVSADSTAGNIGCRIAR